MTRSAHDPRPDEQIRQEQAMGDVSDVLLNIEYAIARAKKGLKRLGDSPEEHNARLALSKAVDELDDAEAPTTGHILRRAGTAAALTVTESPVATAPKRAGTASGREIQEALDAFVARWRDYDGTERAEAQTFLNELFACYGSDRAAVGARFLNRRSEICITGQIGLTTLYNRMDDGAYTDLKALHRKLDEAAAACYGWPKRIAQDDAEFVAQLSDLNRAIVTGDRPYQPFGA
jgi:hypothetical protein